MRPARLSVIDRSAIGRFPTPGRSAMPESTRSAGSVEGRASEFRKKSAAAAPPTAPPAIAPALLPGRVAGSVLGRPAPVEGRISRKSLSCPEVGREPAMAPVLGRVPPPIAPVDGLVPPMEPVDGREPPMAPVDGRDEIPLGREGTDVDGRLIEGDRLIEGLGRLMPPPILRPPPPPPRPPRAFASPTVMTAIAKTVKPT